MDAEGVNLIENGTIDPENILVEGKDITSGFFRYVPADEFAKPDADIRALDNSIEVFIPNEPEFQYIIELNDAEVLRVEFSAELVEIPCDMSYYTPTSGGYSNQPLEIKEIPLLHFLAVLGVE